MSLYDDPDDLLVLHQSVRQDRLSMFVQDYLGCFFPVCQYPRHVWFAGS